MGQLGQRPSPAVPIGFLEKNRDILSKDILTLVYSSKNNFLREIFNLESAETKRGQSTIRQANPKSQSFKVGFQVHTLPATHPAHVSWVSQSWPKGARED